MTAAAPSEAALQALAEHLEGEGLFAEQLFR